jgi:hypothetical protein
MIIWKSASGSRYGVVFHMTDWPFFGHRRISVDGWRFDVFSIGPLSFRLWRQEPQAHTCLTSEFYSGAMERMSRRGHVQCDDACCT